MANVPTPSPDDMDRAAEWLRNYEGLDDDPNAPACKRVADWLQYQSEQKMLRDAAREAKVPVGAVRQRLAQMKR